MSALRILSISALILGLVENAFSHGGHHHEQMAKDEAPAHELNILKIADSYRRSVEPIFQNKCFNCHGNTTQYPWYYSIPGARQLIIHDVKEAKEHLDFSKGYPFSGHGSPIEDLRAIRETIEKGEMPPLRYRLLHWKTSLTSSEKEIVLKWTLDSEKILTTNTK